MVGGRRRYEPSEHPGGEQVVQSECESAVCNAATVKSENTKIRFVSYSILDPRLCNEPYFSPGDAVLILNCSQASWDSVLP
jgi:hypothetical protein